MSWLDEVIGYGTHAARPAAGSAGSLYYETDTATLFRDNGTAWDAFAFGGALPTLPAAQAFGATDILIATATVTILDLDNTRYDQGTGSPQHSNTINPSRLTCQESGLYLLHGAVQYDTNNAGALRHTRLHVNGLLIYYAAMQPLTGTYTVTEASVPWQLSAGDYVELGAYQDSGGPLLVRANANTPLLAITRIS